MESRGARLKKIRLEKGLTLEDVQKKTKIYLSILKAIEEDSLASLSPVYIKGFLKIYCKFLEIDPAEYILDYKEASVTPSYISPRNPQSRPFLKDLLSRLFSFITAIPFRSKKVFSLILIGIFVIVLFNLGKKVSSKKNVLAQKNELATAAGSAIEKTKDNKTKVANIQGISQAKTIRLDLRAKEDCFISLKADGKLISHAILKKGRSESWQAKKKIEVTLNNAKAVELQVNGERISSLGKTAGRKGQVNILIDLNGVNIH